MGKMNWKCLLISLGLAHSAQALVPLQDLLEPTLHFYRSPNSPFPSGEAALSVLKANKISQRQETWYLLETDRTQEWVPEQNVFDKTHFPLRGPLAQSGTVIKTTPVLRLNQGWRPAGSATPNTPVVITSLRSDWACGYDKKGPICLSPEDLLLAIDAAHTILTNDGQRHRLKSRTRNQVQTTSGIKISFANIKMWNIHPRTVFFRNQTNAKSTNAYRRATVIKKDLRLWQQSILGQHGNIWWMAPPETSLERDQIVLTREELQARAIFDQTNHTSLSLVSADGVFLSSDGEAWTLLKEFGDANFPVAIGPRNLLIVGDKLSFDLGRSFQSYLRWDQIALLTQKILKHAPKHLRLQKVISAGTSKLKLHIDTGYKILVFEFNTGNSKLSFLESHLNR